MRMDIDTRDLLRAQRALATLTRPELRKTTSKALTAAAESVVAPEMRKQISSAAKGRSPRRPSDMGAPKRGTSGPLARSVRSKQLRARDAGSHGGGVELVAVGVAPRAWYRHLFIKGTKPHSLAKGASRKNNLLQDVGRRHPGSQGHDIVTATGRAIGPRAAGSVGLAILQSFAKQMGKKT